MTPTLVGRLQSRFFLLLFVGVPYTFLWSFIIPGHAPNVTDTWKLTFRALAIVCIAGLVIWEPIFPGGHSGIWNAIAGNLQQVVTGKCAPAQPRPTRRSTGGTMAISNGTTLGK